MKNIFSVLGMLMVLMVFTHCKKSFNSAKLQVKMTDAPADYQSVFIDLQKVMVHYNGKPEDSWVELKSNPGVYDLLTLRNNVTTIIADDEEIPLGKISQIRLVLGNNNSVVTEGQSHALTIPSSSTSGLKINVHETVRRNDNIVITLDFDAEQSVNLSGNGEFIMNPVIKVKSIENN
jgi:hypothetical protein